MAGFEVIIEAIHSPLLEPDTPDSSPKASGTQILTVVLLLLTVAVLVVIAFAPYRIDRWSYLVVEPRDENLIKELNRYGALNYEVVAARRASSSSEPGETGSKMAMTLAVFNA